MTIVDGTLKFVAGRMSMDVADALLKNDSDGGSFAMQRGNPISSDEYGQIISENLMAAAAGVARSFPIAGALVPVLQVKSDYEVTAASVTESPIVNGVVRTALPISTLSCNPITWMMNAAAQLGAAATDFAQAAAAVKKRSINDTKPENR